MLIHAGGKAGERRRNKRIHEPGETVRMGHMGEYSAREQLNDQIRLRQLNRLIDMDEDQSLSTFEGSHILKDGLMRLGLN